MAVRATPPRRLRDSACGRDRTDTRRARRAGAARAGRQRPLLWIGSGASGARDAVHRLLDLGFVMVSSWHGRGIVARRSPAQSVGAQRQRHVDDPGFLPDMDLALVVGSRLRAHENGDFAVNLPQNMVQIDAIRSRTAATTSNNFFHLRGLEARARRPHRTHRRQDQRRRGLSGRVPRAPPQGARRISRAVRALHHLHGAAARGHAENAIWARDITQSTSTWGNRIFPIYSPRENVYPVSAGIGQGRRWRSARRPPPKAARPCSLPATAASISTSASSGPPCRKARPRRHRDERPRYGVIKKLQDQLQGGRHFFADLLGPDLERLAQLCDMPFWRVRRADALGAAVAEALRSPAPAWSTSI